MASYLQSTRDFLYRRRRPFLIVGGVVGGVYMAASYAVSKLGEMQRRMVEERRDKDNLKRRFAQNQEDCAYTILALLPTLGDQLAADMDVEGLTSRLQKGRVASAAVPKEQVQAGQNAANPPDKQPQDDMHVAIETANQTQEQVAPRDAMEEVWNNVKKADDQQAETSAGNAVSLSANGAANGNGHNETLPNGRTEVQSESRDNMAKEEVVASTQPQIAHSASTSSGLDSFSEPAPRPIPADARLTPSPKASPIITSSDRLEANVSNDSAPAKGGLRDAASNQAPLTNGHQVESSAQLGTSEHPSAPAKHFEASATHSTAEDLLAEKRRKLALWNELKIAAFSRAITAMYGVVLLSLQTHVQLNLLGRYAYLTSVSSLNSSGPAPTNHQIRIERFDEEDERGQSSHDRDDDDAHVRGVDVQTERLYLTLSWWFLHRGWKQLAELVQTAVHEVFDEVGLKTPLTHADLATMLRKVRRRVEYEGRGQYGGADDDATTLGASMASLDARSEWSEATTVRSGFGARARGKRRDFSSILFPPSGHEVQVLLDAGAVDDASLPPVGATLESLSPILPALLDETRDILESNDFWRVMKLSLRQVFDTFESELRPTFGLPPVSALPTTDAQPDFPNNLLNPQASIREVDEAAAAAFARQDEEAEGKSVRLASLFPVVARQSTVVMSGQPNVYIDALANIKELKAFCAVIYAAWE